MKSLNVGVWMDYSHAYIIRQDFKEDEIYEIKSTTEGLLREDGQSATGTSWGFVGGSNNEFKMNNLLRSELKQYFKRILPELVFADEILLFGPTFAKTEFYHFLDSQKLMKGKSIFIKKSDKMDKAALLRFVKDFFVNTRSLTV